MSIGVIIGIIGTIIVFTYIIIKFRRLYIKGKPKT
jgi:hypothetical protein